VAIIKAFQGLRYDDTVASSMSQVLAPPYDVISEKERQGFCRRHPYNITHLTLGEFPLGEKIPAQRYQDARQTLRAWLRDGVLRREPAPVLYAYEQEYDAPMGQGHTGHNASRRPSQKSGEVSDRAAVASPRRRLRRLGFMCVMELSHYGKGRVYPHEATLPAPKQDRLQLMRACQCALGPIFGLYSDPSRTADKVLETVAATDPCWNISDDDGVAHRFWVIDDPVAVETICEALQDRPVVIADGHHRYETALTYRDEMRAATGEANGPWEYRLTYLCNIEATEVSVLPYHRFLREVPAASMDRFMAQAADIFDIEPFNLGESGPRRNGNLMDLMTRMAQIGRDAHVMATYLGDGRGLLLTIKDLERARTQAGARAAGVLGQIDETLLRVLVIEDALGLKGDQAELGVNVLFTRHAMEAVQAVDEGGSAMALLLNAVKPHQVLQVALAGVKMSQKGTYFYPKPLTGAVLHDLRSEH